MFNFFKKKRFHSHDTVDSSAPTNASLVHEATVPERPLSEVSRVLPLAQIENLESINYEGSIDKSPEDEATEVKATESRLSWLGKLKQGLSKTSKSFSTLFTGEKIDEVLYEELETALIMADSGVEATNRLLQALKQRVKREHLQSPAQIKQALRQELTQLLAVLERTSPVNQQPLVMMIAGVNGAGKTTSIGKLAKHFQKAGLQVLLAAGDTFRAAAREQLQVWGDRNHIDVIAQTGGDPAAVAFDAVQAGKARALDVVMIDTAGRLATQLNLMEELKKIKRVIQKADNNAPHGAPHEILLVVDGNTGQNALTQIKAFDQALGLTGLIMTKLDGTAKGGILAAVAAGSQGVRPIPVYFIGVGEGIDDLQAFSADEFAAALVG